MEINKILLQYSDRATMAIAVLLGLLVSSCGESRLTQCEQIFRIAGEVTQKSNNISYTSNKELESMENWLEAARIMDRAANQIKELHINNSQLIKYQHQLITVYRIYTQATYDAVQARENKSLEALKAARLNAQKAGQMQQSLIKELNKYCLNQ